LLALLLFALLLRRIVVLLVHDLSSTFARWRSALATTLLKTFA
jgi:hypothetical protein